MTARGLIPNPTNPGTLRPIEFLTDRGKRYRAHLNPPPEPHQCGFCGSKKNIDLEHVDGYEFHDEPHNKMWACRSCNAQKGSLFARQGFGQRTAQYNPRGRARRNAAPTFGQYVRATLILRGLAPGDLAEAIETVHNTSAARRSEYAKDIWANRRKRFGKTGRRPSDEVPF